MNLRTYATLPMLKIRQGKNHTDTTSDLRFLQKLRAASQEIELFTGLVMQPSIETRHFDWENESYLGFRAQACAQITAIVDGNARTIATSAIIPKGDVQASSLTAVRRLFYGVEIDAGKGDFLTYLTTKTRAIAVTGTWVGFHDDWASAYYDSNVTVQNNPLTSGATSITTSANDSTITDAWGQNWVGGSGQSAYQYGTIHAGYLIQIDSELMQVVAVPDSTHLTVMRGAGGTTAVSHNQNTHILLYSVPRTVQDVCVTWAAWLYYRDSVGFEKIVSPAMGGATIKSTQDPTGNLKVELQSLIRARVA